jgi:flagellar biosynthesis chaperone FliJ
MSVAYQNIIPILTKAIQEQQTIINDLKARVETLEAKLG